MSYESEKQRTAKILNKITPKVARKTNEDGDWLSVDIDNQSINIPLISSQVNLNNRIK